MIKNSLSPLEIDARQEAVRLLIEDYCGNGFQLSSSQGSRLEEIFKNEALAKEMFTLVLLSFFVFEDIAKSQRNYSKFKNSFKKVKRIINEELNSIEILEPREDGTGINVYKGGIKI